MPKPVRMGALVSPSDVRYSVTVLVTEGGERRRAAPEPNWASLDVTQFVVLDDGGRVVADGEPLGLGQSLDCSEDELRDEVRELIFEDQRREEEADRARRPRWLGMPSALRRAGVVTDEASLAGLPFVVEVEEAVAARLRR